jgi:hypothetical protein
MSLSAQEIIDELRENLSRIRQMHPPDTTGCDHNLVLPLFDPELAKGMGASEVRKHFPRFSGKCPVCGEQVTVYASWQHYIAGDW